MKFTIPEQEVGVFVKQASLDVIKATGQHRCIIQLSVMTRDAVRKGEDPQANYIFTGSGSTPDEAIKNMFDEALSSGLVNLETFK
jgi:hypothetical protein